MEIVLESVQLEQLKEGKIMNRTQEEKLDYLLEKFKADSSSYKKIEIPDNIIEKKGLLQINLCTDPKKLDKFNLTY